MKRVILLMVVSIVLSVAAIAASDALADNTQYDIVTTVVHPGDTAWVICRRYNNGTTVDIRKAVYVFKQLNGGVQLKAWQTVEVPVF